VGGVGPEVVEVVVGVEHLGALHQLGVVHVAPQDDDELVEVVLQRPVVVRALLVVVLPAGKRTVSQTRRFPFLDSIMTPSWAPVPSRPIHT
jgi:hypothetical protein